MNYFDLVDDDVIRLIVGFETGTALPISFTALRATCRRMRALIPSPYPASESAAECFRILLGAADTRDLVFLRKIMKRYLSVPETAQFIRGHIMIKLLTNAAHNGYDTVNVIVRELYGKDLVDIADTHRYVLESCFYGFVYIRDDNEFTQSISRFKYTLVHQLLCVWICIEPNANMIERTKRRLRHTVFENAPRNCMFAVYGPTEAKITDDDEDLFRTTFASIESLEYYVKRSPDIDFDRLFNYYFGIPTFRKAMCDIVMSRNIVLHGRASLIVVMSCWDKTARVLINMTHSAESWYGIQCRAVSLFKHSKQFTQKYNELNHTRSDFETFAPAFETKLCDAPLHALPILEHIRANNIDAAIEEITKYLVEHNQEVCLAWSQDIMLCAASKGFDVAEKVFHALIKDAQVVFVDHVMNVHLSYHCFDGFLLIEDADEFVSTIMRFPKNLEFACAIVNWKSNIRETDLVNRAYARLRREFMRCMPLWFIFEIYGPDDAMETAQCSASELPARLEESYQSVQVAHLKDAAAHHLGSKAIQYLVDTCSENLNISTLVFTNIGDPLTRTYVQELCLRNNIRLTITDQHCNDPYLIALDISLLEFILPLFLDDQRIVYVGKLLEMFSECDYLMDWLQDHFYL